MDMLGRDDELRSLHAFLDRPRRTGMAALVLEGEAGIGKSTLWLAGVEAARERGLRVLVLSARRGRAGSCARRAGRPARGRARRRAAGAGGAAATRARDRARSLGDEPDEPVDFRTLAVAVRNALQLLAERGPILVAIDDVQWLDASSASALAFALRRLPDAGHSPAPDPPARRTAIP